MGNLVLTADSIRNLIGGKRSIQAFDHGLIGNHTATGTVIGSFQVSGETGLRVFYVLDTMVLNHTAAMSGVITSGPVSGTLNPGNQYINYIQMVSRYQAAHSGEPEASYQGMMWDPQHAPIGTVSGVVQYAPNSGVVNIVPEYRLVRETYAAITVDYYPDNVAAVSGLLPVSRLRLL